jgi:hypothetical protein
MEQIVTARNGFVFSNAEINHRVRQLRRRRAWRNIVRMAGIVFSGRDTAAGKNWEAWLKKYWEKKAAGEKNIELQPEKLD